MTTDTTILASGNGWRDAIAEAGVHMGLRRPGALRSAVATSVRNRRPKPRASAATASAITAAAAARPEPATPEKPQMKHDQAYCMKCKSAATFAPITTSTLRNGALVVSGLCLKGHRVSRITTRENFQRVITDLNNLTSRARNLRAGPVRQSDNGTGAAPKRPRRRRSLRQGDVVETKLLDGNTARVGGKVIEVRSDGPLKPGQRIRGYFLGSFVRAFA